MRRVFALALLLVVADSAYAQQPDPPSPDFFVGRPHEALALRGSWIFAREGSDLFDFVQRELTIDDGNFDRAAFATDYGITLSPRIDAVIGFEVNRASIPSEYRDLVDNNRRPIEQTTSLTELNLTGNIRFNLLPRGRGIGRFAWGSRRTRKWHRKRSRRRSPKAVRGTRCTRAISVSTTRA